jgi:hypothetical protein
MTQADAGQVAPAVATQGSSGAPRPGTKRRRWPPTLAFALGAGFAVWGLSIGLGQISDNSFFTHLATGRLIAGGAGIPRHDIYSFTARGEPWVVQSWLASVIYGWIDSWFGAQGIRVLMGITTAFIAAMTWRLTRPAKTLVGRILICGLVISVGTAVWSPRPLLIGLAMLTIALVAAEGDLPPWTMVPVFWIWVNTHGSFPLGLVALGTLWLGRRADLRAKGGAASGRNDGSTELRCLAFGVLGTVLGAVNPLGPTLLTFPVHLLGKMDVLRNIIEWQSPSFALGWARLFLIQVVVAVVVLVRRPSYRAAIPLVVFTAAALLGQRNIPVAGLVLVPGMARGLSGVGSIRGDRRSPVSAAVLVAVLLVGALVVQITLAKPAFDLRTYPVAPLAWLDAHGLHRGDLPMASSDTTGNYLELVYGSNAHAFIDDRIDMYPASVVDDYLMLEHGLPDWERVLDRRKVELVLWDRSSPLTALMAASPQWRMLYQDGAWTVSCRRGSDLGQMGTC